MAINYIPNDPGASPLTVRKVTKVASRPSGKVRFVTGAMPPEKQYATGTPQFVAWQCRQAALLTLDIYESVCGKLKGWQGKSAIKTLKVIPDSEEPDLNAYYNRASISFFHSQAGGRTVYSGASTDVVAHEAGHAILDALRPDLWDAQMIEPAAFHEGFGDCIAVLVALSDKQTRVDLLAGGASLSRANIVEATAEDLSAAIKAIIPGHSASAPRRAFNAHKWALPQTLPANGGPTVLINESHSLGQLVSGVYWDLISFIYAAGAAKGEAAVWKACQAATRLIVKGASQAPIRPRFFETWGRSMMVIDAAEGGANGAHIKAAFANHGIIVGTTGFLTPQMAVAGAGIGKAAAGAAMLPPSAKRSLRGMLGVAPRAELSLRRVDVGDQPVAEVSARQQVDLSGVSAKLDGVVTHVPRPAFVGQIGRGLALLGSVQNDVVYASEVRDFVGALVKRSAIDFGDKDPPKAESGKAAAAPAKKAAGFVGLENATTHVIEKQGSARVLKRATFACGCPCRRRSDPA